MKLKDRVYSFIDNFRKPDDKEIEKVIRLFGIQDEPGAYLVRELCSITSRKNQERLISGLGTIYKTVYEKVGGAIDKKNEVIAGKDKKIGGLEKELETKSGIITKMPAEIVGSMIRERVFTFCPEYFDVLTSLDGRGGSDASTIRRKAGIKSREIAAKLNVLEKAGLIRKDDNNGYCITETGKSSLALGCIEEEKESDISIAVGGDKNYIYQFEKWLNTDRGSDHTPKLIKICKESSCLDEVGKKFFKDVHNEDRKTQEQHMRIRVADYGLAAKITLEKFGINYESLFSKKDSK